MNRYSLLARTYDVLSGEPVYRAGRRTAIEALRLSAGQRVLDVGTGTGLNVPLLLPWTLHGVRVTGVDSSPAMLRRAALKANPEVLRLVSADATAAATFAPGGPVDPLAEGVDAVLFTYALSLMPKWREAWRGAVSLLRPGGRVAVVDMQRPLGAWRLLSPAARLACALGGADIDAHPWTLLEQETDDVERWSLRGGHVQVRVGTRRG